MSRTPVSKREFGSLEEKFSFYNDNPQLLREEFPADRFLAYIVAKLRTLPAYHRGDEVYILRYGFGITLEDFHKMKTFPPKIIKGLERAVKDMERGISPERMYSKVYFYGNDLMLKSDVLCPRPETELLVDRAIKMVQRADLQKLPLKMKYPMSDTPYFYMTKEERSVPNESVPYVLDLCCGSGAIGVSIAKACPFAYVTLSDVSVKAMNNARCNIHLTNTVKNVRINAQSNMFEKIEGKFDLICCNPPYISEKEMAQLPPSVTDFDPELALYGGKDGLDFYRVLASKSRHYLRPMGSVIMEIGYRQGKAVQKLFESYDFTAQVIQDYAGKDRIVIAVPKYYE